MLQYTLRYFTCSAGHCMYTQTHKLCPSGAGVAVYGAEVQSSCVYSLHRGLASEGTDTCGKQKRQSQIDM